MSDEEDMKPEPANMDWLLTFADLISLLITFFVLLYSMKVVDTQKWDELRGSFSGVFSIREPIYQVSPDQDTAVEKIDPIKSDNLDYVQALLHRSFATSKYLKDVKMSRDLELDTLTVQLPSYGMFHDASEKMSGKGFNSLVELGDILRHLDNRIVVATHTAPKKIATRRYPSNWELSMLRSIQITNVLKEQGIEKSITSLAYAEGRFDKVAPHLPLGERIKRAQRVEIILHGEQEL